jgi:hypothetical protein
LWRENLVKQFFWRLAMKIPNQVTISDQVWTVKRVWTLPVGTKNSCGTICRETFEIKIVHGLSDVDAQNTFLEMVITAAQYFEVITKTLQDLFTIRIKK